jgi:DNA-directed RNA polymerase specialized sigma24 family protein
VSRPEFDDTRAKTLVEQARAGNAQSMAELFEYATPHFCQMFQRLAGRWDVSEHLVACVRLGLWTAVQRFETMHGTQFRPFAWLHVRNELATEAGINCCPIWRAPNFASYWRQRYGKSNDVLQECASDPEAVSFPVSPESWAIGNDLARTARECLPPRDSASRRALIERWQTGLHGAPLARKHGISVRATVQIYDRVRTKIAERLGLDLPVTARQRSARARTDQ